MNLISRRKDVREPDEDDDDVPGVTIDFGSQEDLVKFVNELLKGLAQEARRSERRQRQRN